MTIEEKHNVQFIDNSDSNNCNPQAIEVYQTQIALSNKGEDIITIKRKIEIITTHLKHYISIMLNEVLQENPINANNFCYC